MTELKAMVTSCMGEINYLKPFYKELVAKLILMYDEKVQIMGSDNFFIVFYFSFKIEMK